MSVSWVTLWVRPPLCVHSFGNIVGASPPCVCLFVRLHCGCVPPLNVLWWKTTFIGRRPSVEDKLRWKTTFGGRCPLVEDGLRWKTTFSGRQPSVEDDPPWKKTFGGSLHAAYCLLRFATFFHLRLLFFSIVRTVLDSFSKDIRPLVAM